MTTDPCSKLRPNLSRAVRWPRESALTAALRGGIIMADAPRANRLRDRV